MMLLLKARAASDGSLLGERQVRDDGAPFTIGRGPQNDWVLEDPQRHISKVHCQITVEAERAELTDLSSNGVFFDGDPAPVGQGRRRTIVAGDTFTIGDYRFAVADAAETTAPAVDPAPLRISEILDGAAEAGEGRLSQAIAGEAPRWLGKLPRGAADDWLVRPHGWSEPPTAGPPVLVPVAKDHDPSELTNASERTPAINGVLRLPIARRRLPDDWYAGEAELEREPSLEAADPALPARANAAAVLLEAAGLSRVALANSLGEDVLARAGSLLRLLVEGLDRLEAAASSAEKDLGLALSAAPEREIPRDLATLLDPTEESLTALRGRLDSLVARTQVLGESIRTAASEIGNRLRPETVERSTRASMVLAVRPFVQSACWRSYAAMYGRLERAGGSEPEGVILGSVRAAFERGLASSPERVRAEETGDIGEGGTRE